MPARLDHPLHLFPGQTQCIPIDDLQALVGAQACHRGRWIGTAGDDHATALGNFLETDSNDVMHGRGKSDIMIVVQDDDEGTLETGVQLPEVAPGENLRLGGVFGRHDGKRLAPLGADFEHGLSQVQEKRGYI